MPHPSGIITHYFSCKNVDPENQFDLQRCWDLMVDLNLPKEERSRYLKFPDSMEGRAYASAHVLIGRGGEVWKLVDFEKQAYHAGYSMLNGRPNCNAWTLGAELIGTNTSGFTDEQYEAYAKFIVEMMGLYPIELDALAGHDAVRYEANMAGTKKAARKIDPSGKHDGSGDNFEWERLSILIDQLSS